jgi:hypothetical protein
MMIDWRVNEDLNKFGGCRGGGYTAAQEQKAP